MNLGQANCLSSRAPILDLWLEITKSRKLLIEGFICSTKVKSQTLALLRVKMAQTGKQMRVFKMIEMKDKRN
jgi:hypothetical protein